MHTHAHTRTRAHTHTVALNYQTAGKSMDWNDGKFLQNGRCGYVLKPDIMREGMECARTCTNVHVI